MQILVHLKVCGMVTVHSFYKVMVSPQTLTDRVHNFIAIYNDNTENFGIVNLRNIIFTCRY